MKKIPGATLCINTIDNSLSVHKNLINPKFYQFKSGDRDDLIKEIETKLQIDIISTDEMEDFSERVGDLKGQYYLQSDVSCYFLIFCPEQNNF